MKQRLVILGTGFGAFSLLQTVRKMDADLIVVSPRNHFLFTPLLASTTVGTLEFRSIIESIRTACPNATFHMATVESLDLAARSSGEATPLSARRDQDVLVRPDGLFGCPPQPHQARRAVVGVDAQSGTSRQHSRITVVL